jgi:asparagine synthase (glutamine-hydrolysing)
MCGILFSNYPNISKSSFTSALYLMRHRGPDVPNGYFVQDETQFGHCRLKILDLDNRSNQPFFSRDNRYVLIFNGEIYNYKELAKKYDIHQSTLSDTEILVELYNKLGVKMLSELNGMFVFVIYDLKKRSYFIARDRLGIKPLYYQKKGKFFIFSSEIAPLISLLGTPEIDDLGLRQYKKLRTFFNGRTIYKDIQMFPAGYYMLDGKFTQYWTLTEDEKLPPETDELTNLIQSAVNYRCLSDVPVGSYLSGGLDSTIVACLSKKPHTWTVGFPDNNEFEWARLASEKFQSEHKEVEVQYDDFLKTAKQMIQTRMEPLSVPNEVLLYLMTKAVKKKNTVVLSGEGADELFFGYDRIFRWASQNKWDVKEFSRLYSYGSGTDIEIVEDAISPFVKYGKAINIVAAFFQIAHLHGLLRRLDNSTMMCSVEARVPFVDHRLVEMMAGTPFQWRMGQSIKEPLKKSFSHLIPKEIVNRKKVGFPVPLNNIFPSDLTGDSNMDKWLNYNINVLKGT